MVSVVSGESIGCGEKMIMRMETASLIQEETHSRIDMAPVYAKYPTLERVESQLDFRFQRRRPILYFVPRWKVGAEIGVFTGAFSEMMLEVTKPLKFYAVDPWWVSFGENFPNWGDYSAGGTLETRAAYEAAKHRTARFKGAEVVPSTGLDWINSLEANALDWAYIDSTHQYDPTLAELLAISEKLAPDGVLLGDDCWPRRDNKHYGVYRAVRDFCRMRNFELISLDGAGQWAARKSID